jgi:hypothetical protein
MQKDLILYVHLYKWANNRKAAKFKLSEHEAPAFYRHTSAPDKGEKSDTRVGRFTLEEVDKP